LLGLAWTVYNRPSPGGTTAGQIFAPQVGFPGACFFIDRPAWSNRISIGLPGSGRFTQFLGLLVAALPGRNGRHPFGVCEDTKPSLGSFTYSFPICWTNAGAVNQMSRNQSLPHLLHRQGRGRSANLVIGGPLTIAGLSARIEALLQESP